MNDIHSNLLADFLCYLDEAENTEVAFEKLSNVISILGFDAISYTLIPRTLGVRGQITPVFLSSRDFSTDFLKHYQQANLAQHDFSIRRISDGCSATLDWDQEIRTGILTSREVEVIEIARYDYGITNAITFPTEQSHDILAGFSLTSSLPRRLFSDLLKTNNIVLNLLCRHFHHFIFRHSENRSIFYSPVIAKLNYKECCMLDLVTKGRRLKQSQDYYGIAPKTAGVILHRLYKKFSVRDRGHLGYLIGRHQLVEMLNIDV